MLISGSHETLGYLRDLPVGITISLTLNDLDVGVFMAGIVAERSFWW